MALKNIMSKSDVDSYDKYFLTMKNRITYILYDSSIDLTDWEINFLEDLSAKLDKKIKLTPSQVDKLEEIEGKD